jgi:hypothetical protein
MVEGKDFCYTTGPALRVHSTGDVLKETRYNNIPDIVNALIHCKKEKGYKNVICRVETINFTIKLTEKQFLDAVSQTFSDSKTCYVAVVNRERDDYKTLIILVTGE